MTRQRVILRAISFLVAGTFLWNNCVWADAGLGYKLAAPHQAGQIGQMLANAPAVGELMLANKKLEEWGIHSLADVVSKMGLLEQAGIMVIPLSDSTGKEARYLFDESGVILRITEEDVSDDLYELLKKNNIKRAKDGVFEWFRINNQRDIDLINSFLGGLNRNWVVRRAESVGFEEFLRLSQETAEEVKQGRLPIVYGYNIKEMIDNMRELYELADQELNNKYDGKVRFTPSVEKPDERRHDFPGALGIIEKFLEGLKKGTLVMVTDGGFKNRFAYKILSEGYNGLLRLPGKKFNFMREMVVVMLLTFMKLIPDYNRFIGWAASDNFVVLGRANIGGVALNDSERIKERTKDAVIIKGGVRITLLTKDDLQKLGKIAQPFTEADIKEALGEERFNELLNIIEEEKLKDLGMLATDGGGRMIAFLEKEKDTAKLIELFCKYDGTLYKNPFLELVDKEFFAELYKRLHEKKASTHGIGTLDRLPVSFMQCVYQSRFVEMVEWMNIAPKNIDKEDWGNMKLIIDDIFKEFNQKGKGQIYVVDFGEGNLWVDLANLDSFNRFMDSIVEDEKVKEALGCEMTSLDEATVKISEGVTLRQDPNSYIENTLILGEGELVIEKGVLISGAILEVKGKLTITKGSKILLSDLRGVDLDFWGGNTIIDRYFPESGGKLTVRSDERVGTLKIGSKFTQARNILSLPFKGKKIGDLEEDKFGELQKAHPEYLGQFRYQEVKDKDFSELEDKNLAGFDFTTAQGEIDYLWIYRRIEGFLKEIENVGAKEYCSHLLPQYLYEAFRDRLVGRGMVSEATVDEFIAHISYTDKDGVVHISEGYKYNKAVGIMAEVLREELSKKAGKKRVVTKDDVLAVLQMHEEMHRIIKEYNIDIQGILNLLVAFFSGDISKVDALLIDFTRNYNYLPWEDLKTYQLTDSDRLMLVEELLVHTIVERRNFNQPVRVIDQNGVRDDLNLDIEKILVGTLAGEVVGRFSAGLSNIDKNYLLALYNKFLLPLVSSLKIGDNFFPSAMLTEQERQTLLGAAEYSELAQDSRNTQAANSVRLTLNPMDGGTGTAVRRVRYLERLGKFKGYDEKGNPILGSKSSDLYFEVGDQSISVMEAKLIKAIVESGRGSMAYKEIAYQLLGGKETMDSLNEILDKPCLLDPNRTYREYIQQETNLRIEDVLLQANLPTVEKAKSPRLTTERLAPGGHGQWGVMILLEALGVQLPDDGTTVIRAFYNGDGINNGTDPVITGWMARENVPIIMISTTKAGIDKKGGQIGVQYLGPNRTKPRVQMMELAQAKKAGQEQLFYRIGLPEGEKDGAEPDKQYFNTNTALLNYSVLTPFLTELVGIIGIEKFVEIIAPDLIENEKEQDGKKFIQIEGALGSALLNLAAFIETTNEPDVIAVIQKHGIKKFLRIVNVDKQKKNTFDYWFQFHSGRFRYDSTTWELVDKYSDRPLPVIDLADDYYSDVQDVIEAFEGVSVSELESLTIKGKVKLAGAELKGTVCILNGTKDVIDINDAAMQGGVRVIDLNQPDVEKRLSDYTVNGRFVLENVILVYGPSEAVGMDIWINVLEYMKADPDRLDSYINTLQQDPGKSIGGKVWIYIVKHAKLFPGKDARELFDLYFIEQRKLVELEIKQGRHLSDVVLQYARELTETSKMLKSAGLGGIRYISYMYDIQDDRSFDIKLFAEGKGGFRILGSDSRDKRPGAATARVQEQYSHRIYGREEDELIERGVKLPLRVIAGYGSRHFGREVSVWTITNPFPIFDRHIQLIWPEGIRQKMNLEFLRITIEFLRNTPGMSGFFNSMGANASQNHPHVQLFPETDNNMALDTIEVEHLFTKAGIMVGMMGKDKAFPVSGFVLEPVNTDSATLDSLAIMVQALVEDIMIKNIPYNLVFRNNKVYIFPRNLLPAGQFGQSFAGAEMIGHLLLTAKELLYTPWVQDHPEVMNIDRYNMIQDDLRNGRKVEEHRAELENYVRQAVEHLSLADIRKAYERVCLSPGSVEFRILKRDLGMVGDVMEMQRNEAEDYVREKLDTDDFYLKLILLMTRLHPEVDKRIYEEINFLLEREELIMAGKQLSLDIGNLEGEMKGLRYKITLETDKKKKESLIGEYVKKQKQLSQWRELLSRTRIEFGLDEPLDILVSDELKDALGAAKIAASSLSKKVDETRKEVTYSRIKIDMLGNIVEIEELVKDERANVEAIKGLLRYLVENFGEGALGPVKEIVIVDNLGGIDSEIPLEQRGGAAYFVGEKMVIDIDVFRNLTALRDAGAHEISEAVLRLVEKNPGIQEVTATYSALEVLLELTPEEVDSYIEFLKQPDNGLDSEDYAKLLEAIRERKDTLTREDLIALSVGYVLNTHRYVHLKDGLASVMSSDIENAREKLELARNIYRDIVEAKKEVSGLKKVVQPVISEARFAKAKAKVRMIVSRLTVVETGFVEALLKNNKYIMLDRSELAKPENEYIRDWVERITKGMERNPFIYSDEGIPEGVRPEDVIDLREPEKVNERLPQDRLYLPLPYSISSIYLASQVVLAGGKVGELRDKLALNTIRALYDTLLGRDVTDNELEQLFRMPWKVLPPIVQITATLNAMRKAIQEIEAAA